MSSLEEEEEEDVIRVGDTRLWLVVGGRTNEMGKSCTQMKSSKGKDRRQAILYTPGLEQYEIAPG